MSQALWDAITRMYAAVDEMAEAIATQHSTRLQCRLGCSGCCVDGLTVFEVEAAFIEEHAESLLDTQTPHPKGACAFLDEAGGCRIYAWRPYVCRTQGLPLRWIEEGPDGLAELRDICELNLEGSPLETLPESACWTIGPFEERLAGLQSLVNGPGPLRRVTLRSLWGQEGS